MSDMFLLTLHLEAYSVSSWHLDLLSLSHLSLLARLPFSSPLIGMDDTAFSSLLHIPSHNGPTALTPCSSPSHLSVDTFPWVHRLPIWHSTVSGAYERRMGWFDCKRPTEEASRQSVKESLNPHVGFMWVLVLPRELFFPLTWDLWLEFLIEMTDNWAKNQIDLWCTAYYTIRVRK